MSLPEICPLDGKSVCKTNACHLYHKDWRSGEVNCSIGYGATKKSVSKANPFQDTYAQKTSIRLGKKFKPDVKFQNRINNLVEVVEENAVRQTHVNTGLHEEILTSDRNTTVIYSKHESENKLNRSDLTKKKGKSIDDIMDIDLPDDYEKNFWS